VGKSQRVLVETDGSNGSFTLSLSHGGQTYTTASISRSATAAAGSGGIERGARDR
jgi:adenylosuccinate synthase